MHHIQEIFPTAIYTNVYDGANVNVDAIETEYKKTSGGNLLSKNYSVLDELHDLRVWILDCAKTYAEHVLGIHNEIYITNSWIVKNPKGTSHPVHFHPNVLFSSVFYVSVPQDSEANNIFFHKSDVGFFDFYSSNRYSSVCETFHVIENQIIMFPGNLKHGVNVNTSDTERVSIGTNFFIKGDVGMNEDYSHLRFE